MKLVRRRGFVIETIKGKIKVDVMGSGDYDVPILDESKPLIDTLPQFLQETAFTIKAGDGQVPTSKFLGLMKKGFTSGGVTLTREFEDELALTLDYNTPQSNPVGHRLNRIKIVVHSQDSTIFSSEANVNDLAPKLVALTFATYPECDPAVIKNATQSGRSCQGISDITIRLDANKKAPSPASNAWREAEATKERLFREERCVVTNIKDERVAMMYDFASCHIKESQDLRIFLLGSTISSSDQRQSPCGCNGCQKVFLDPRARQRHMTLVHYQKSPFLSPAFQYRCPTCNRLGRDSGFNKSHSARCKGVDSKHVCGFCKGGFIKQYQLVTHLLGCVGLRPHQRVVQFYQRVQELQDLKMKAPKSVSPPDEAVEHGSKCKECSAVLKNATWGHTLYHQSIQCPCGNFLRLHDHGLSLLRNGKDNHFTTAAHKAWLELNPTETNATISARIDSYMTSVQNEYLHSKWFDILDHPEPITTELPKIRAPNQKFKHHFVNGKYKLRVDSNAPARSTGTKRATQTSGKKRTSEQVKEEEIEAGIGEEGAEQGPPRKKARKGTGSKQGVRQEGDDNTKSTVMMEGVESINASAPKAQVKKVKETKGGASQTKPKAAKKK